VIILVNDTNTIESFGVELSNYLHKHEPDFYYLVTATIQIEIGAHVTKVLSGELKPNDIAINVLSHIKDKVPKDVYSMSMTGLETEDERNRIVNVVNDALIYGIEIGVIRTIEALKIQMNKK
jgi:hypothetical protein